MIKIYGMPSCPDCSFVERQAEGREGYEVIDIGSHVRLLKEFLRLRDSSPVFDDARRHGRAGIPCFVLDDGRVTLVPEEAGLKTPVPQVPTPPESAQAQVSTKARRAASTEKAAEKADEILFL